jgi:FkbM family methyltransferase
MSKNSQDAKLSLLAQFLRAYLRSNIRGQTRLTYLLANRLRSLQAVPIKIADWAPVYMDLRLGDSQNWLKGSPWESSPREVGEQAVMRRVVRRGDIAFDIGANVGLHTVLLARLVGAEGRVLAFEPNSELLPALCKTVGGLDNASLYSVALSDHAGEATLYVPNDHSMGSLTDWTSDASLAEWRAQIGLSEAQTRTCELQRMDDMVKAALIPPPDFIKCDVEGAELMVFQGGRETLNRAHAPVILFEANEEGPRGFGLRKSAAADFLVSLPLPCYHLFEVLEEGGLKSTDTSHFESSNLLAVPQSKLSLVSSQSD